LGSSNTSAPDGTGWVDYRSWTDNWEAIEKLPGGGQGEAFKARRKTDGQIAFAKAIKAKKDPERRARFFREASAYESFDVLGIPRLIESNAHRHKEPDFQPYITTEFVEGPTLREWRQQVGAVDLARAVSLTESLLRILASCHAAGVVHRDIKPENIIVATGAPESIALLDFGLNYHELPEADFQTEHWQEIGNRFLRLPELSAGSGLKQDSRSDVTFAAAIFFYILTGKHPDILQDAEGRLPHQRGDLPAILQSTTGAKFRNLVALFDQAFDSQLANRYPSVQEMRRALEILMAADEAEGTPESDLAAIRTVMDTSAERRRAETAAQFRQTLMQLTKVFDALSEELGPTFQRNQTGHEVTAEYGKNTHFWTRAGSRDRLLTVPFDVRQAGDELVVRISDSMVYRTPIGAPDYGEHFRSVIRTRLLSNLRATIFDPSPLPTEAEHFGTLTPLTEMELARAEATRTGRRIFLFTYDPALPERGRLDHALRYFLQNEKTRRILAESFVIALVPVDQVRSVTKIVDEQSMENARWIIFDDQLNALEQAVVHANPQAAEGIASHLAERYGPIPS
jgi:eukaryotic-like serine/threonine-protein kinase